MLAGEKRVHTHTQTNTYGGPFPNEKVTQNARDNMILMLNHGMRLLDAMQLQFNLKSVQYLQSVIGFCFADKPFFVSSCFRKNVVLMYQISDLLIRTGDNRNKQPLILKFLFIQFVYWKQNFEKIRFKLFDLSSRNLHKEACCSTCSFDKQTSKQKKKRKKQYVKHDCRLFMSNYDICTKNFRCN